MFVQASEITINAWRALTMALGQGLFGTSSHLLRTSTDRWHGADIERHLVDLKGRCRARCRGFRKRL